MKAQKVPKILFLYDFPLKGGGSGHYIKYLALRLFQRYNHSVAIAAPDKEIIDDNIPLYSLKLPQTPVYISRPGLEKSKRYKDLTSEEITDLYYAFMKETLKVVQDFKPDIISVHHTMINSWVARYIRSLFGIKYVITSHGSCLHAISQDRRYFRLTRDALRAATAITVVSGDTRAKLLRIFGQDCSEKTRTITGGVNLSLFPPKKDLEYLRKLASKYKIQDDRVVLFTGRLISEKGIEYLIKAANKIRGQIIVAGDGPQKKLLENIVIKTKLTNVKLLGFIDHKTLLDIYYLADIFVSPSVWDDPMPLSIIEAMAAKLPVVVTRRGGVPSAVKDNYNGFFVRSRNTNDIIEKVNKLLDSPDLRKKMGERGRLVVEKKFTWTKIAEKFHKLFVNIK